MYVANTAILEHRISAKNITSDYGFLLRLVNAFPEVVSSLKFVDEIQHLVRKRSQKYN